jgi:hypothetical protein
VKAILSAKNCFALAALLLNILVITDRYFFMAVMGCKCASTVSVWKSARRTFRLTFRGAESAREIDDETDQQNQAKAAAADDGTAKVKPAAAEQEKQNKDD